jgi:hypothetical protein
MWPEELQTLAFLLKDRGSPEIVEAVLASNIVRIPGFN